MRPALPLLLATLGLSCGHRAEPSTRAGWVDAFRDCRAGDAAACLWVGVEEYEAGNYAEATKHLALACEAGLAQACAAWGRAWEDGRGVPRDVQKARALYQRACEGGSGLGCNNLGIFHFRGIATKQDGPASTALYARACALGYEYGCVNHANAVAEGRGVPKDVAYARATWRRACPHNDMACRLLANLVAKDDVHQAIAIGVEGCSAGGPESCANAAFFLRKVQRLPEATRYARTACRWNEDEGCYWLGVLKNEQAASEDAEAERVLAAACGRGHAPSCYYRADLHRLRRGESDLVLEEFEAACRLGEQNACVWLCGRRGVDEAAARRATPMCAEACKRGHQPACTTPAPSPPAAH